MTLQAALAGIMAALLITDTSHAQDSQQLGSGPEFFLLALSDYAFSSHITSQVRTVLTSLEEFRLNASYARNITFIYRRQEPVVILPFRFSRGLHATETLATARAIKIVL